MTPCKKSSVSYQITISESGKKVTKCPDCFEQFKMMAIGHEDKYSVEVLRN